MKYFHFLLLILSLPTLHSINIQGMITKQMENDSKVIKSNNPEKVTRYLSDKFDIHPVLLSSEKFNESCLITDVIRTRNATARTQAMIITNKTKRIKIKKILDSKNSIDKNSLFNKEKQKSFWRSVRWGIAYFGTACFGTTIYFTYFSNNSYYKNISEISFSDCINTLKDGYIISIVPFYLCYRAVVNGLESTTRGQNSKQSKLLENTKIIKTILNKTCKAIKYRQNKLKKLQKNITIINVDIPVTIIDKQPRFQELNSDSDSDSYVEDVN